MPAIDLTKAFNSSLFGDVNGSVNKDGDGNCSNDSGGGGSSSNDNSGSNEGSISDESTLSPTPPFSLPLSNTILTAIILCCRLQR